VHTETQLAGKEPGHSLIPDVRNVPLAVLAARAADGSDPVHRVVSRIVHDAESASGIPAMMFNSAV
jgi:hypothetical protein